MTYQLTVQRMTLATAIFLAIALTLFLTALSGTGVALAQANDQGGNSPATGLPTITGTAQVGETLTADRSGIADEDGVTGATFSYQWVSSDGTSDTDIAGATIATYTPVSADEGQTIKVRVSFTDDADNQEMLTSAPTAAVAAPAQADSEDEPSELSYLTVVVTEDDSDPSNVVTTFTITWNDAENCSASYNAYLDGVVGDPIHLGSAASEGEQIAASLTNVSAESIGFDAKLYCGTIGSGRLVDRLSIPEYGRSFDTVPISRAYLPKPGNYSTEPGLTALTVSSGTLTPGLSQPNPELHRPGRGQRRRTDHSQPPPRRPTTTPSHSYRAASTFISSSCSHGGQQTFLSYQDDTGNPLYPLTDADANTPGFQMDLDEGENVFVIHVKPNCETGHLYKLTVTRATNAPANTPATGAPTIGGTAQVGQTLTASTSGIADADGLTGAMFSYQWLSSRDTEIQGATGAAYILVPGDVGKTIKVKVSFTDDEGNAETLTSAATGAVAPRPNSPATGAPTIGGTAQVGQTLTASTSGIADADGLTGATFSYQWLSSRDTEIQGATGAAYILVPGDAGKTIRVKVSFTDDEGNAETLTSAATGAVAPRPNSPATGAPTIGGTAQVGQTLTASTSGIADADGLTGATFSYQWLSSRDTEIQGATGAAYILVPGDAGKTIKVRVSFTDDAGNNETLTSEATDAVAARPNSPATGLPTITGTAVWGQEPTADTSGIQDANGMENVAFRYQWFEKRAGATYSHRIDGETSASYRLKYSEVGSTIWVRVYFTDDAGNEESLDSAPTATVASDHGDTPATATELREGSTPNSITNWEYRSGYFAGVAGNLPSKVDQDWFRLNITQAQSGYKKIYFYLNADPNKRIALYDSSVSCLLGDCETDNGRWGTSHFYFYLEPGIYYIRVTGPGGNSPTDSNDPYEYYNLILIDQPSMTAWYDECAEIETGFADPLYGCQTHLFNQDHPGEHINVEPVWDEGILGEGINVAVVDQGVDYTHEDLGGVIDLAHSTVYPPDTGLYYDNGEYYQFTQSHGTAVGAIIGGQHNSRGIRGIAPMSRIYSYRHPFSINTAESNEYTAKLLTLNAPDVAVSSNSWDITWHTFQHLYPDAMEDGITGGFHGKGTVYVFGSGYTGNSNDTVIGNVYAVIQVCGVGIDGRAVDLTYSGINYRAGYGASLWVCAPYRSVTAIRENRYREFLGTSAATPMVSGVAALVRSANPELTWRDVKLILAASARQNDTTHEDWADGAVHYGGGPERYHFNPNYGFGVVDAAAAVALAKSWVNMPPMTEAHRSTPIDHSKEIPEDTGDNLEPLQVSFGILDDGRTTPQFVEHVEINIDLDHESGRDLDIWLTSPSGTVSRLYWPTRVWYWTGSSTSSPIDWEKRFGSSRHLGENPIGQWTLSVIDRVKDHEGLIKGASITIRGHRNIESPGDNSKPTGEPTVSGTAQVGQSLRVDTSTISDEDGLTNAVFQYQWIASDRTADTEIRGATEADYALDEEDVGKAIWVRVTFTDDAGNEETLTSTQSAPVAARPNTPATGLPTISGTAQVAETLAASISDIEDADGLTGATFSYQWVSSDGITDTDIREATSATYTLVVDDIGKTITVRVNYTDDRDFDETLTSAPTAVVEASPNIPATGLPSITGAAEVGETLSVTTSGIQDANGMSGATFSYQWVSNDGTADMDIQEVTSTSYTLVADDIGKTIKVRVSFTDDGGNEETLTSAPTAAVEAKLNIPATGLLTIRGKAQVGETLTADTSGVADHNGLENANFSYQWLADDTAIDGATGREYTLAEADQGKAIKVRVSFTDDGGNEETLTSAPTAPVWGDGPPGAPRNLTATAGNKEVTLSWEPPDRQRQPASEELSHPVEGRRQGLFQKNAMGHSAKYHLYDERPGQSGQWSQVLLPGKGRER